MTTQEIEFLKEKITLGWDLFWSPDDSTCKMVIGISKKYDEPFLCVFFQGGTYVALDGCEIGEFIIGKRLTNQT